MKIDIMHPAEQITTIMSRIYRYQMTTTSGGNLSILDEAGDIWISPGGYDKGSITEEDIVQIKPDGTVIGIHAPSSELPFHQALIQKRPGTRAVLHAHPPALVAFSIARKLPNVKMLPEAALICGELAMADYDVPGSRALGDKILETFLENKNIKAVILENHGVVIASDSLFEAFRIFEALEYCARLELKAKDLHRQPVSLTENQIRLVNNIMPALGEFTHTPESYEKKLRKQMVAMIQRAYHQRLFNGHHRAP